MGAYVEGAAVGAGLIFGLWMFIDWRAFERSLREEREESIVKRLNAIETRLIKNPPRGGK